MKLLIAVRQSDPAWDWPAGASERLREHFPQLDIQVLEHWDNLEPALRDADIYFGWRMSEAAFAGARRLRWIHSPAAGVQSLLVPALITSGIPITNARAVHGPVVAEHALALMLALARGLHRTRDFQAQKKWAVREMWQTPESMREIRGSTVMVLGLGEIGGALARHLRALGAQVIGIRRHPGQGAAGADEVYAPEDILRLLPRAHWVVLAMPVSETSPVLGPREFAAMRPDAIVINVGRGALLDEAAITQALAQGKIAAAGLDVFDTEPLPASSPLWSMKQVLITPHLGSATHAVWSRELDIFEENLRRWLAGEPLLYTINPRQGY